MMYIIIWGKKKLVMKDTDGGWGCNSVGSDCLLCTPEIQALGRYRQEDQKSKFILSYIELEANLGYVRHCPGGKEKV